MDNTQKEIEIFKPSKILFFFLFVYYSIWLIQSYSTIYHYITFGCDEFIAYQLIDWINLILFLSASIYSFFSIIKTLRGDADCITSLKWSLIIVLIYALLNPIRGQIATYDIWLWSTVFFARPLFYLTFYFYLCFAKAIKIHYPKSHRKFSPSGWIWLGITIIFTAIGIYSVQKAYYNNLFCRKIDTASIKLKNNEICDGYIIFQSNREWDKWISPHDTLLFNEETYIYPTLQSTDSLCKMYLASGQCNKPNTRTYNQVIVSAFNLIATDLGCSLKNIKESSFSDSIINNDRILSTHFEINHNSVPNYINIVMVSDINSPKCCVFITISNVKITQEWPFERAKSIHFNLKDIHESQQNKNSQNSKGKNSNRTSEYKQQSNANFFYALLYGRIPRKFICKMLFEYKKREIANYKSYNIFYNQNYAHNSAKL